MINKIEKRIQFFESILNKQNLFSQLNSKESLKQVELIIEEIEYLIFLLKQGGMTK